jgi:hypothetical protein
MYHSSGRGIAVAESASKRTSGKADDAGQAEVQQRVDEEEKQGYAGEVPDETPNENYTLQGVTSDKPTPENQRKHPNKK